MDKEKEYRAHVAKYKREQKKIADATRRYSNFQSWLSAEKERIVSVDMIAPWVRENTELLIKMFNIKHANMWCGAMSETGTFDALEISVRYSDLVSNTHSCPRDGKTNWGGRSADIPRGYKGWYGDIKGRYTDNNAPNRPAMSNWSDFFKMIDIHTGTGGGAADFRYGVEIFLSDWPNLSQQLVINKLLGI